MEKVPAWATCLLIGIPFGAAMGTYSWVDGTSPKYAVISGAITGLIFGIAMTLFLRRQNAQLLQAVGDLPPPLRRAANRAMRGAVPADPEVRAAAIRMAKYRLSVMRRWRTASLIIWGLLLALAVITLLNGSLWRLVLVALFLLFLVFQFTEPRRLRARIELLESADV
jgi:uncharacterized membrane protein (UPF0136 family)